MFYLILKYAVLFALAALLGFVFGRWWARRSFVDVTRDYVAMSRAAKAPWERVWQRFDAVETSVREARSDLPTGLEVLQGNVVEPVRQGFASLHESVAELENHLRTHPAPAAGVDLAPLEQRLAALDETLREQSPAANQVDLYALLERVSTLNAALAERGAVDFAPLEQRLGNIERRLESLQVPDLNRWLDVIEKALRNDRQTSPAGSESLDARLSRIEQALSSLSDSAIDQTGRPAAAKTAARARKPAGRTVARGQLELSQHASVDAPNLQLLESAQFGSKDDLKRIAGIGPKLERELNRHGVFYFWQLADWTSAEIEAMDERLEAFRGRIERDAWVPQARRLMNNGGAARRPGGD